MKSLRDLFCYGIVPGVETPGYSHEVPSGLAQCGIWVPALKRRTILMKSLRDLFCYGIVPGVETPGYSHEVPSGLAQCGIWVPALKRRAILMKSLRDLRNAEFGSRR